MIPLNNNLFIIPITDNQKTAGGLSTSISSFKKAKVIFHAKGLSVKEGDIILFSREVGMPFTNDTQEGLFITEQDITAIL